LKGNHFLWDDRGDAVVEATILFPIIIMIFAALVLLAMYLPTRALLQEATQEAATAIATTKSDTWLYVDESANKYKWISDKDDLPNVYVSLIDSVTGGNKGNDAELARKIVELYDGSSMVALPGTLTVDYGRINYVIYKEVTVTATRTMPMPVNLEFVGFPKDLVITVSSTAVVQDGDEFVRTLDIAVDLIEYIDKKYHISDSEIFKSIKTVGEKLNGFLGI